MNQGKEFPSKFPHLNAFLYVPWCLRQEGIVLIVSDILPRNLDRVGDCAETWDSRSFLWTQISKSFESITLLKVSESVKLALFGLVNAQSFQGFPRETRIWVVFLLSPSWRSGRLICGVAQCCFCYLALLIVGVCCLAVSDCLATTLRFCAWVFYLAFSAGGVLSRQQDVHLVPFVIRDYYVIFFDGPCGAARLWIGELFSFTKGASFYQ